MRNPSGRSDQDGSDEELPIFDFLRLGSHSIPTPAVQPSSSMDGDAADLSFDFLQGQSVTAADLAFVKDEDPADVSIPKPSSTVSYPHIDFDIQEINPGATWSFKSPPAALNSASMPELSFPSFGAPPGFHGVYNSIKPAPQTTSTALSPPIFSFGASTSSPFHPRTISYVPASLDPNAPKPTTDSDNSSTDPPTPIAASFVPTSDVAKSVVASPTPSPMPSAPLASLPPSTTTSFLPPGQKPVSLSDQTAKPQVPTHLAKDKGRSCWMPFDSEEEALRWARKLPHGEAGRLMAAITTEGMETHPPPVAPFLKWSPLEAQVDQEDPRKDQAGTQRSRDQPADVNSMKSVFESLPADWQASLKASVKNSREFAGFQAGMISSAALESQLIYLQRWLLTLVNHYQRNLELSANMTTQMASVEKGLEFRLRDIDLLAVITGNKDTAGGNKE
ncbi:hypothetical protein BKA70DRAFT_1236908 [Coprinopsis sp. MPI-PUGE-AT-0042]|nr:hypothetical protein BKA70DRAFT_1236908 [Coprinopsis sp. MPI-PUGE-AT-0042]